MDKPNIATVKGLNLPISTKTSVEICSFIRYKQLKKARKQLNLVLEKRLALPLKRFHKDRGHRKGAMGPGFFPQKAAKEIIKLLNSAESNAENKGLNIDLLFLKKIVANKASRPMHSGRNRGQMKRTNIEVEVRESETKEKPTRPQEKKSDNPEKEKSKTTKEGSKK